MVKKILLALMFVSCFAFAKQITIDVVTHGTDTDPFWNVVKNGINNAKKDMGVKVVYRNPSTGSLTQMARLIHSAVARRPDGLVVSVPDADALGPEIKRAIALGIPVITINAGEKFSKKVGALMHVGQSEYHAGYLAGLRAKKAGVKNFMCVNHEITNSAVEARCRGFAKALGVKNNMLDVGKDPTNITQKVEPRLKGLDAVLVVGEIAAGPTARAIAKAGLKKHIYFVTFDLSKKILSLIKKGVIDFAIDQQPYLQGYMPIVVLTQYIKYGVLPSGNINSGPGFITKANVNLVEKYAGKYR